MKLASLKTGRDGKLVVVNRDLTRATDAQAIAGTLQAALDRWSDAEPELLALADDLEHDRIASFEFVEGDCAAPLPRAYQWADGSAYVNHVELVRQARNASLPESFWHDPLLYQGGSDDFLGPHDDIEAADEAWGVDFEAELAVITDDVPPGCPSNDAGQHIKLFMLVNDVSLRELIPGELAKGFGFFVGKPATSFSPVAVTPDEFGAGIHGDVVSLPVLVQLNGTPFGQARPDVDQVFTFPDLIAHAAQTRRLSAGTIIGGGTVSNKSNEGPGLPINEGGVGYSCIAELRAVETIRTGAAHTSFMRFGDTVSIEMLDVQGRSIFGRIEQTLVDTHRKN